MRTRALLGVLLAVSWFGCASSRTRVVAEDGEDVSKYHRIGVLTFTDRTGKGKEIADDLAAALQNRLYNEAVDHALLDQIISKYKIDTDLGLGVEALEEVRDKTSADALIFGSMTPDWSAARVTMVETEMGGPVLRAVVFPKRGKKKFRTPQEIADEIVRAFVRAH